MHKKAIELSINFLVMLILSLLVFSAGVTVLYRVIVNAQGMAGDLSDWMRKEIEQQLIQGKKVAVPFSAMRIDAGDHDTGGLGIRNDVGREQTFYVKASCDLAVGPNKVAICDDEFSLPCDRFDSWLHHEESIRLLSGEQRLISLLFTVPKEAEKGTYTYYISVCMDIDCVTEYDTVKSFTIIIG
jgi:hypothetical protein